MSSHYATLLNAYPFEAKEIQLLTRNNAWRQTSCPICVRNFENTCVQCLVDGKTDACEIILFNCGHIYHMHCVARWFGTRTICPIDGLSITDGAKPVTRRQAETMISKVKNSAARLIQAVAERYFLLKYGSDSAFAKKYIVDFETIKKEM